MKYFSHKPQLNSIHPLIVAILIGQANENHAVVHLIRSESPVPSISKHVLLKKTRKSNYKHNLTSNMKIPKKKKSNKKLK